MPLAVAPLTDVSTWARSNGLLIVLDVLGAVLLTRFVNWLGQRVTHRIDVAAGSGDALVRSEAAKHRHAVAQVLTWTSVVLIYFVTAVLVADRLGIPLTSLVAPATVAGVALGFGAQRVVQDILAGFFLIAERQYGFGDVIRISALGSLEGVSGTVEDVTLRITRIRSSNGEVVIVPNGQIVQVTNLSRDWARAVVDVPLSATSDVAAATDLLREVGAAAFRSKELKPLLLDAPTVMGVETLSVDELTVRLVARTLPGKQFEVGRALRGRVAAAFRKAHMSVPAELDAAQPTAMS
jgi:small conductance mechanosensitive channel